MIILIQINQKSPYNTRRASIQIFVLYMYNKQTNKSLRHNDHKARHLFFCGRGYSVEFNLHVKVRPKVKSVFIVDDTRLVFAQEGTVHKRCERHSPVVLLLYLFVNALIRRLFCSATAAKSATSSDTLGLSSFV